MRAKLSALRHWRPGAYARASADILVWLVLRAVFQAASVVLLGRELGAVEYGQFVAALAITSFFTPLAGLGLQGVVLRDGARDPAHLPTLLRAALRLWWASSLGFGLLAGVAAWVALPLEPVSPWVLLLLGLSEVAASSGVELLARSRQARQHTRAYGVSMAGLSGARFVALLIYAAFASPTAQGWMMVYSIVSLLYLVVLRGTTPQPAAQPGPVPHGLLRAGLPFAVGALSFRLQAEFNKPVLARLSYADVGAYNIAQRVVDLISLPLSAMQESLWPRLFADSQPGRRLRSALVAMLALAMLLGGGMAVLAPLVPKMLGADYAPMVAVLIALAWLPAVQTMRNVGNAALITSGRTHTLTRVYVAATLASVALTLLLVPRYGLLGAVLASYLGEAAAISTQGFYLLIKRKGGRHV